MAKYLHGIAGPISGKIGPVVGSSWRGIPYLKGKYRKRTGRVSDAEKANRNKFAIAASWLFLSRTSFGLRIRGSLENPTLARACGISTQKLYSLTFAFGAFSLTGVEIVVFVLIFGWISLFIRYLGVAGQSAPPEVTPRSPRRS